MYPKEDWIWTAVWVRSGYEGGGDGISHLPRTLEVDEETHAELLKRKNGSSSNRAEGVDEETLVVALRWSSSEKESEWEERSSESSGTEILVSLRRIKGDGKIQVEDQGAGVVDRWEQSTERRHTTRKGLQIEASQLQELFPPNIVRRWRATSSRGEHLGVRLRVFEHDSALSLERVVLLPTSKESYKAWVLDAAKGLQVILNETIRSTLLARGTRFGFEFESLRVEFEVLDTLPLLQGLVSPKTTVVVVDPSHFPSPPFRSSVAYGSEADQEDEEDSDKDDEEGDSSALLLSQFISRRDTESVLIPLWRSIADRGVDITKDFDYKGGINGLLKEFDSKELRVGLLLGSLSPSLIKENPDDPLHEVVVSFGTLAHLKIFDGTWVVLTRSSSSCFARLVGANEAFLKNYTSCVTQPTPNSVLNFVFLPPTVAFTLGLSPEDFASEKIGLLRIEPPSIPVAKKVVISRVRSANSSGYASYSKALSSFFSVPRLLVQGQVIGVPKNAKHGWPKEQIASRRGRVLDFIIDEQEDFEDEEDQDTEEEIEEAGEIIPSLLYFKVEKIESENGGDQFAWVDRHRTMLVQQSAVFSRIPSLLSYYYTEGRVKPTPLPGFEDSHSTLSAVLAPCIHPLASSMGITCTTLLCGPKGCGKRSLVTRLTHQFGIHLLEVNCFDFVSDMESQTPKRVRELFEAAWKVAPCLVLLRNFDAFGKGINPLKPSKEPMMSSAFKEALKELSDPRRLEEADGNPVLVIATSDSIGKVPGSLRSCFRHEIVIEAPDARAREAMLEHLTKDVRCSLDVSLSEIASLTASFVARDLSCLVSTAVTHALNRLTSNDQGSRKRVPVRQVELESLFCSAGVVVTQEDFETALDYLKSHHSTSIGAPKVPNVRWEDVGGLAHAKKEILDTIQLPLKCPQHFASGISQRSGILLYGPPGTGKTLLAKAVATECSLNFLSVKGPELINMHVGESEKNVRDTFAKARKARPCVVFFDELDSLAPNRGRGSDSGGVMDRVVSQLLAELDGLQKGADVFVIGATNRPDLIDPALLRPGRFDRLLFLSVTEDHPSQLKVLEALTRKFLLGSSVDLARISEGCPLNFTGADFYALCSDAMVNAIKDKIQQATLKAERRREMRRKGKGKAKEYGGDSSDEDEEEESKMEEEDEEEGVVVEEHHFLTALKNLNPSVSPQELIHYKQVAQQYGSISGGGAGGKEASKHKKPNH